MSAPLPGEAAANAMAKIAFVVTSFMEAKWQFPVPHSVLHEPVVGASAQSTAPDRSIATVHSKSSTNI